MGNEIGRKGKKRKQYKKVKMFRSGNNALRIIMIDFDDAVLLEK